MILLHLILYKQTPKAPAGDMVHHECPDLQIVFHWNVLYYTADARHFYIVIKGVKTSQRFQHKL